MNHQVFLFSYENYTFQYNDIACESRKIGVLSFL